MSSTLNPTLPAVTLCPGFDFTWKSWTLAGRQPDTLNMLVTHVTNYGPLPHSGTGGIFRVDAFCCIVPQEMCGVMACFDGGKSDISTPTRANVPKYTTIYV